ncbi:transglycosylase domain-containing protein [Paenibacillus thermotolerans]|uniref:transglycosylase domain-containing protein n=1 Tax=Paenibacillus thermotolerans TaxID=3027807 RepID=UPI00236779C1|nr:MULTISPECIES: transglycosylase domain-containing protein [unclassified Paenibacillus]
MEEPLQKPNMRVRDGSDDIPLLRLIRRIKRIVVLFVAVILCAGIGFAGLLLYLRTQPLPQMSFSQSSQILDANGELIDSFHGGRNRHIVKLDQISPYMVQATLAIEDKRFYQHFGFDPIGLARAVWIDIKTMKFNQGASTLTQQLARNLFLSHERTFARKVKELLFALQLEMEYTKSEILAMYLNEIYFGHGAYGIQAASQMYFGKDAKNLSLEESALLAGVMKSWKYYSPYMDYDRSKARQKLILDAMAEQGVISASEAEAAYARELALKPLEDRKPSLAPYFRDYVRSIAVNELGIDEKLYDSGGITVYTTLDLRTQRIAEETMAKYLDGKDGLQAALVSIDPRNGHIRAMVGGRDYEENQYNRVFAKTRQPGSSFKPILYLTALQQEGFTATTRFKSEPTVFTYDEGRKTYAPQNFGNRYPNDYVDLRYAISRSDNIYAVNTIMQVGADKVIETARNLGIDSPMEPLPSLALGTFPVSPFEMASAFGTIANHGVRMEPMAILKIVDSYGRTIYENHMQSKRAVDARYAYVLTHLMESVFDDGGTGSRVAQLIKRPVAGKTGTTNTDAWMVGFTPELATAVWVGHDQGREISTVEAHSASPIFAEFTEHALETVPPKLFQVPEGVVNVYIDPQTGMLATADCPNPRLESFIEGTEPTEYCTVHSRDSEPLDPGGGGADETKRNWWQDLKRWWNS